MTSDPPSGPSTTPVASGLRSSFHRRLVSLAQLCLEPRVYNFKQIVIELFL